MQNNSTEINKNFMNESTENSPYIWGGGQYLEITIIKVVIKAKDAIIWGHKLMSSVRSGY